MDSEILIYLAGMVFLLILIILLYLKDMELSKKINRYENAIENLLRQNHQIKKYLNDSMQEKQNGINAFEIHLKERVNQELNSRVFPVLESLRGIEDIIEDFKNEHQSRLSSLEERTRSINKITTPSIDAEEKRIVELFKNGKTMSEISKDLRIGMGRVEFVLKLHRLLK